MKRLILIALLWGAIMTTARADTYFEFGIPDTTTGSIYSRSGFEYYIHASKVVCTNTGILDSLGMYLINDGTNNVVRFALYRRSDSLRVDTTAAITLTHSGTAWISKPVLLGATVAPGDYMLAVTTIETGCQVIRLEEPTGAPDEGWVNWRDDFDPWPGWPSQFTTFTIINNFRFPSQADGHTVEAAPSGARHRRMTLEAQ